MNILVETAEDAEERRECNNVISAHLCELCGEKTINQERQNKDESLRFIDTEILENEHADYGKEIVYTRRRQLSRTNLLSELDNDFGFALREAQ